MWETNILPLSKIVSTKFESGIIYFIYSPAVRLKVFTKVDICAQSDLLKGVPL